MYDLLISEGLFERVTNLQNGFAQSMTKADQDKAKRLARVLHDCNEALLRMHEDAAGVGDMYVGPGLLESGLSGRGGAGAGASRGSAAGGSEQFEDTPAREEAPASGRTSPPSRRTQAPVSQGSEDPVVQEVRRRANMRVAADTQSFTAGVAATLEQTRLNEPQQGAQESKRSSGSRGQPKASPSTNPKKAKTGRSKK